MPTALPEALATYFEAIDANRSGEAISCFAPDAQFVAPNASRETGPRLTLRGDAIAQMLRQRPVPTWTHDVTVALNEGHLWFIEGGLKPLEGSGYSATFVAEVVIDECDRIERFAAFRRHPAIPPVQDRSSSGSAAVISALRAICAETRRDAVGGDHGIVPGTVYLPDPATWSGVSDVPVASASLPRDMRVRAHLAGNSVGACVGVASHPDNEEQYVDFALEIALGPSGRPDRLALFWAETAAPAE